MSRNENFYSHHGAPLHHQSVRIARVMKNYMGIDPGKSGGFAIINSDGKPLCVKYWDDEEFIRTVLLYRNDVDFTVVERVGAMPGQGVTSCFSFGKSAGFIEGALSVCKYPYQLVLPKIWKNEFNLNSDKSLSIETCMKLFPGVNLYRTPKCTKLSDGMAEALLMAEYARRHM